MRPPSHPPAWRAARPIGGVCGVVLALAVAACGSLAGAPRASAAPASGADGTVPPLPACAYADEPASPTDYGDWQSVMLDTRLRLAPGYAPPDLVSIGVAGLAHSGYIVRSLVIDDLRAMAEAARAAGAPLDAASGYRGYDMQAALFDGAVAESGAAAARRSTARPGHSEHQLGTALDFASAGGGGPWNSDDWATTPAGRWLLEHGWEYGFVESYPKGKEQLTCYAYEPWHYRYFGREVAREIHDSGLTSREWLWDRAHGLFDPASRPAAPTTGDAGPRATIAPPAPIAAGTRPAAGPDAAGGLGAGFVSGPGGGGPGGGPGGERVVTSVGRSGESAPLGSPAPLPALVSATAAAMALALVTLAAIVRRRRDVRSIVEVRLGAGPARPSTLRQARRRRLR